MLRDGQFNFQGGYVFMVSCYTSFIPRFSELTGQTVGLRRPWYKYYSLYINTWALLFTLKDGSSRYNSYSVQASKWSDSFNVTRLDCNLLRMHEMGFVSHIRKRQYSREPCNNQRPRCDIAWFHVTNTVYLGFPS
jgi:hypothetical protein